MKIKNLKIFTLLISLFLTQNAFAEKPLQLPVSVPIDITKKGNKSEIMIEVKKNTSYAFELEFHYDDPRRSKYRWVEDLKSFFPSKKYTDEEYREIMKDNNRVRKLVGTIEWENGKRVEYKGIPTPIHLTITKIESDGSEKVIFDKVKETKKWGSGSSVAFYKIIRGYMYDGEKSLLSPGIYKVSIESEKDSPELIGTKIHLLILESFYGK